MEVEEGEVEVARGLTLEWNSIVLRGTRFFDCDSVAA